jgi:HD-like signal output (HDOD) protein
MECALSLNLDHVLKIAGSLPPGPRLLAELRDLLQDGNSEPEAIMSLLRRDGTLTARIIRIANGVAFRRGEPIGSLEGALLQIGFLQVYGVVGIASVSPILGTPLKFYPIAPQALRENALLLALLMEELAPGIGEDPGLAYTAGLLCPIGKIALDLTAQITWPLDLPPPLNHARIVDWERDVFGLSSTEAAGHILRAWRFPVEVFVAIRDHRLEGLAVDPIPMAKLLHLASAAVAEQGRGLPGESSLWERHAATARQDLAIDDDRLATAMARATARFETLKSALE